MPSIVSLLISNESTKITSTTRETTQLSETTRETTQSTISTIDFTIDSTTTVNPDSTATTTLTTTHSTTSTSTHSTTSSSTHSTTSSSTYSTTSSSTYTTTSSTTSSSTASTTHTSGIKIKEENFIYENGIVKCKNANINDYGKVTINGETLTFVARNRHKLQSDILTGNIYNLRTSCTSHIHDMSYLFANVYLISSPHISTWDVSGVVSMHSMFENTNFVGDISNWDVGNVRTMENMFRSSSFNGNISQWNVENARVMNGMFEDSGFSGNISQWNTPWIKKRPYQFQEEPLLIENLPKWPISNESISNTSQCRFHVEMVKDKLYSLLHDHLGYVDTCQYAKKLPPNWILSTDQSLLQSRFPPLSSIDQITTQDPRGIFVKNSLINCSKLILIQHIPCPIGTQLTAGCNYISNNHCSPLPPRNAGHLVPFQFRYDYDDIAKPLDTAAIAATLGWNVTTSKLGRRRDSNSTFLIVIAGCKANLQNSIIVIQENMPILLNEIISPPCPSIDENANEFYIPIIAAISLLFMFIFCTVLYQQNNGDKKGKFTLVEELPKYPVSNGD